MNTREAAKKYALTIAPALQTDYHRQKHAESFLAGHAHATAEILALVEEELQAWSPPSNGARAACLSILKKLKERE